MLTAGVVAINYYYYYYYAPGRARTCDPCSSASMLHVRTRELGSGHSMLQKVTDKNLSKW
jgi:hypothetical protein